MTAVLKKVPIEESNTLFSSKYTLSRHTCLISDAAWCNRSHLVDWQAGREASHGRGKRQRTESGQQDHSREFYGCVLNPMPDCDWASYGAFGRGLKLTFPASRSRANGKIHRYSEEKNDDCDSRIIIRHTIEKPTQADKEFKKFL